MYLFMYVRKSVDLRDHFQSRVYHPLRGCEDTFVFLPFMKYRHELTLVFGARCTTTIIALCQKSLRKEECPLKRCCYWLKKEASE